MPRRARPAPHRPVAPIVAPIVPPIVALIVAAIVAPLPATIAGTPAGADSTVDTEDAAGVAAVSEFERDVLGFVGRHCVLCHGPVLRQGELDLARFAGAGQVVAEAALWRRVVGRVERGEMPPVGMPRPAPEEVRALAGWLAGALGPAPAEAAAPPETAPVLRRLTRHAAANVVRDVLGVTAPVAEWLPPDPVAYGFDTVGSAQALDTLLFERLVLFAERVAEAAVVVAEPGPPSSERVVAGEFDGARADGRIDAPGEVSGSFRFRRTGEYLLRVAAWAEQAGGLPAELGLGLDGVPLGRFVVEAERADAPQILELRAEVEAGVRAVGAAFLNDYYAPGAADPGERDRNLLVLWIEVVGPIDRRVPTEFQTALLASADGARGERRRLEAILDGLALRLWRRPLAAPERRALLRLSGERDALELRVQRALAGLLASPSFWFLVEDDPAPGDPPRRLDGYELAARLALFLWASVPDAELLALAASGELADERVLARQVERLLADPRQALGRDFAPQWLQVRQLEGLSVDAARFPEYDADLRAEMLAETSDFFDALLAEDRDARELLTADWTVAGPRLAAHYGVAVEPPAGRAARVALAGTGRRGVLGQAAVLTATSDPTRTSPVKRGKWVLDALLGAPPAPPPPGVPSLDEGGGELAAATVRERLERHRTDPACAACHAALDPLGLGLERFDPIGRERSEDGGRPVDASAALPDGRAFDGAVELAALVAGDERFLASLTEKLAVYALGRGLGPADAAWLAEVVEGARRDGPTLRRLVRGIALSEAFRTRGRPHGGVGR